MEIGEVWVETGELLGEFPDGDDKEEGVEDDNEAHGPKETPDETIFNGQPAAGRDKTNMWLLRFSLRHPAGEDRGVRNPLMSHIRQTPTHVAALTVGRCHIPLV